VVVHKPALILRSVGSGESRVPEGNGITRNKRCWSERSSHRCSSRYWSTDE